MLTKSAGACWMLNATNVPISNTFAMVKVAGDIWTKPALKVTVQVPKPAMIPKSNLSRRWILRHRKRRLGVWARHKLYIFKRGVTTNFSDQQAGRWLSWNNEINRALLSFGRTLAGIVWYFWGVLILSRLLIISQNIQNTIYWKVYQKIQCIWNLNRKI